MEFFGLIYQRIACLQLFRICTVTQTLLLISYSVISYLMTHCPSGPGDNDCTRLKNEILLLMAISLVVNTPCMVVTIRTTCSHKLLIRNGVMAPCFFIQVTLSSIPVCLILYVLSKAEEIKTYTITWFPAMSICVLVVYLTLMFIQNLLLFQIWQNMKSSPDMDVYAIMVNTEENVVIPSNTPSHMYRTW